MIRRESLPDIYTWKQKINHKRMVWVSVLGLLLKTLEHCYTSQINKFRLLFALNSENLQNNYFTLEGLTSFSPAFQQILAKNNFKFIQDPTSFFCTYSSSSIVKILNSIGRDITFYMQRPKFILQTSYLSTWRVIFLVIRLSNKKI
jgi:hypothetical protein